MNTIIKGTLYAFSSQGTEGTHWAFNETASNVYDGLTVLVPGDHLTIYNPDALDEIVWSGNINFEYNTHRGPMPLDPSVSRQVVNGCTVNGLQHEVSAEEWDLWFFNAYPAELVKVRTDTISYYGLTDSSMIHSYAHKDDILYIQFTNGDIYKYFNVGVHSSVVDGLLHAASKGKYFIANIRDAFQSVRMEVPTRPELPAPTPFFPFPTGGPPHEGDDYTVNIDDFGEMTEEEEKEFLAVLNDPENDGMNGATT